MGFFRLCDHDPLVKTLSEVFRANIVRVPEERIQPLRVIAARHGRLAYCGRLADLLAAGGSIAECNGIPVDASPMADVAGRRSRQVDARLGLDILEGFLRGFGLPTAAGIREQFTGASAVSFSFSKVQRFYVDPARVGRWLAGRVLDGDNPVAATFLQEDPWDCLLIDSIITSRDFAIHVERSSTSGFQLKIPAIQQMLANAQAQISVASTSALGLTFQGSQALTFAFSCQRLILDAQGRIVQMPPDTQALDFFRKPEPDASPHVLLADRPAMLEWDEP